MYTTDAPTLALNFLRTSQNYIEPGIYARAYPEFQYRELVPVDNSAPEWVTNIDFYSMGDDLGEAAEFNADGDDINFVDFEMNKGNSRVTMAAVGYRYNLQELEHARMYGIRLTDERANVARRRYEKFIEDVAFLGRKKLGLYGVANSPEVARIIAPNGAGIDTSTWETKTEDEILEDINSALSSIYITTNGLEYPDTVLLPLKKIELLVKRRLDKSMQINLLDYIKQANVYTQRTGRPLTIRGVFGLDTAGQGGTNRMVVYRRAPDVVKLHIPMPLRWLEAERTKLKYEVPGIFRFGGVEFRLPGAARYVDGI